MKLLVIYIIIIISYPSNILLMYILREYGTWTCTMSINKQKDILRFPDDSSIHIPSFWIIPQQIHMTDIKSTSSCHINSNTRWITASIIICRSSSLLTNLIVVIIYNISCLFINIQFSLINIILNNILCYNIDNLIQIRFNKVTWWPIRLICLWE